MISVIYGIQKNDTNELIYKTETRLTGIENKLMFTKGESTEKRYKLAVWN